MQLYKVIKPFEFDNKALKLGEEIVCSGREGEDLLQKKLVTNADKELDAKNPAHKPMIDAAQARKDERHAGIVGKDEEREADKQYRATERDVVRGEKIEKAKKLFSETTEEGVAIPPEDLTKYERMSEEELDKHIEKMESGEVEEEDDGEEKPVGDKPVTPGPRTVG